MNTAAAPAMPQQPQQLTSQRNSPDVSPPHWPLEKNVYRGTSKAKAHCSFPGFHVGDVTIIPANEIPPPTYSV